MAGQLPIEIEEFIYKYIDSLEELEILLLVSASPETKWTADAVYQRIKSSTVSVSTRLEALTAKEFLVAHQGDSLTYEYKTSHPQTTALVQALAATYKERPVKVVECIFSKPLSSLRIFADAFKIRKDQENG